ncbi:hypothetical protein D3C81_1140780 [compost metagenome]
MASNFPPPVIPDKATAPPYRITLSSSPVPGPPTGSTTAAHFSRPSAPLAALPASSAREITREAPRSRSIASCAALPVLAVTSKPSFERMSTAMLPTPPVAPVTRTEPFSGVSPLRSSSSAESAAVKPAVPMAMASFAERPGGRRTSQSAGSLAYSA